MRHNLQVSIPAEIASELNLQCAEFGLEKDRWIAAILLAHLNGMNRLDPGWDLLDWLDEWELSDRQITHSGVCHPRLEGLGNLDDDDIFDEDFDDEDEE